MKSTPYQLCFYYLPGAHPSTPEAERKTYPGIRMVGGFQFTDGAMSLRLQLHKSERQRKYLFNFHQVSSEVIENVDVPSRATAYSPKSEFEGILGAVDPNAPGTGGQSSEGGGAAKTGSDPASSLDAIRAGHRERRSKAGSSVATAGSVDPAARERALNDEADGLT